MKKTKRKVAVDQAIKLNENASFARGSDDQYLFIFEPESQSQLAFLRGTEAAVFKLIVDHQPLRKTELMKLMQEKFELSGISVDSYLTSFIKLLKSKDVLQNK